MNIKIPINMTILSILSEFENALAEDKSKLHINLLFQLVNLTQNLPHPASGQTYQRWQLFAQIAGVDLSRQYKAAPAPADLYNLLKLFG